MTTTSKKQSSKSTMTDNQFSSISNLIQNGQIAEASAQIKEAESALESVRGEAKTWLTSNMRTMGFMPTDSSSKKTLKRTTSTEDTTSSTKNDAIVSFLKTNPGKHKRAAIIVGSKMDTTDKNYVSNMLAKLHQEGKIQREGNKASTVYWVK